MNSTNTTFQNHPTYAFPLLLLQLLTSALLAGVRRFNWPKSEIKYQNLPINFKRSLELHCMLTSNNTLLKKLYGTVHYNGTTLYRSDKHIPIAPKSPRNSPAFRRLPGRPAALRTNELTRTIRNTRSCLRPLTNFFNFEIFEIHECCADSKLGFLYAYFLVSFLVTWLRASVVLKLLCFTLIKCEFVLVVFFNK